MTKDLGLAQDAATRTQAATPLGSLAHQVTHDNYILIININISYFRCTV